MLERSATTDALTGLPNRVVLEDRLRETLRSGQGGAIAFLDLDRFKEVNDRHGHRFGDALLIEVGRRLRDVVDRAAGATVARVGGDEFVVLLPATAIDAAEAVVRSILVAIASPHRIGDTEVTIGLSAGLAPIAMTAERTLRAADVAMYAAKQDRSQLRVYTTELAAERRAAAEQIQALRRRNAELVDEARTDALTGLPNRRRYDEDFAAIDRAAAIGFTAFSVIVIDIDYFGRFNHSDGGQDSGDRTLRLAAEAFAEAIREDDIVYRRGGEEFVVLLPDAALDEARQVAMRIAATLHRHDLPHPNQERVTASIGVAAFDPTSHVSSADVVTAADNAMRRAKDGGRDRIVVYRDSSPQP